MNSCLCTIARFGIVLLGCVWALFPARAHEPFDISSQLIVHEDRIELTSTLGIDAARHLLAAAGLSAEQISTALRPRGPDDVMEHPATLAQQFFRVAIDRELLAAQKVTTLSEGMEVIMTVVFPRGPGQSLTLNAACYETIPKLRKGVLRVLDAAGGKLGAALFSAENKHASVTLPPPKAAPTSPSPHGAGCTT